MILVVIMSLKNKSKKELYKSKCWDLNHRFFKCIETEFSNNSNYKTCIKTYNDYIRCVKKIK